MKDNVTRTRISWSDWIGPAAACWSFLYGALGAYWGLGGAGFPFGSEGDPAGGISILGDARAARTGPIISVLGVAGCVVALVMARRPAGSAPKALLISFGTTAAFVLTLLIPDYRLLVVVAYAPIVILGAPFDFPPDTDLWAVVTWPVVNQIVCAAGGVLWAGATLVYARVARGACPRCGRRTDANAQRAAARWGRPATLVAVAVPLIYALTRLAWVFGLPLGISEELQRQAEAVNLWYAGAALAGVAIAGALLTLGLVMRWGEVVPRRLPVIGGRRVPPALAVVPASVVALLVTSAGLMYWRMVLGGGFRLGTSLTLTLRDDWGALLPELLWPFWGVSLGAATLAYHLRRRGRCGYCGRAG
jgi:hypothetical protein